MYDSDYTALKYWRPGRGNSYVNETNTSDYAFRSRLYLSNKDIIACSSKQ